MRAAESWEIEEPGQSRGTRKRHSVLWLVIFTQAILCSISGAIRKYRKKKKNLEHGLASSKACHEGVRPSLSPVSAVTLLESMSFAVME